MARGLVVLDSQSCSQLTKSEVKIVVGVRSVSVVIRIRILRVRPTCLSYYQIQTL